MKILKKKQEIDFCEKCGKDVEEQKISVIECDCGFYHYPCKKCFNKEYKRILIKKRK
jgi:hypothetical protein